MAFREMTPGVDDSEYWNPTTVGEAVEGNVIDIFEDNYEKTRVTIELAEKPEVTKTLPAHSDLLRYTNNLAIGEYIRVELKEIQKSNNPKYADKRIYRVLVDDDKAVEYE